MHENGPDRRTTTVAWPPGEEPVADPGFVLPSRWKVARLLGRGGQAVVCLAEDTELGEWVAVKVFHPGLTDAARERIRREVRLGRSLQHPGLVRVFELIESGDRLAVVMELVSGGSVASKLESGPLAIDEVVRIADETLGALAFLHREGVVHRDIKPSNLLLDAGGRVRLADLGLVRRLDDGGNLTRTATTVGTPQFMSPEQIRGELAGPPADLYSLGVTLFHLLTGKAPFEGASEFEVAHRHLRATPPDPRSRRPDCPRWLARFVLRLLEKAPGDRFKNGAAALEALRRRLAVASPSLRRRVAVAAGLLVVLGGAGLAGWPRWPGAPARVTVANDTVVVGDTRGNERWRHRFGGVVQSAVLAEFMAPGVPAVAVSAGEEASGQEAGAASIQVLGNGGDPLTSIAAVRSDFGGVFPELSGRVNPPLLSVAPLDRAGTPALIWIAAHSTWYPSVVGMWAPRVDVPPSPLLYNSGHIVLAEPADLDDDGALELVAIGLNNPLGYQGALIVLRPFRDKQQATGHVGTSPDLLGRWLPVEFARRNALVAYTPIGQVAPPWKLRSAGRSGIVIESDAGELRFDAAGNPIDSALAGRGAEPRQRFWSALGRVCLALETGGDAADIRAFEEEHREALAEAPMRLAADLMLARGLARSGRNAEAVDRLAAATRATPSYLDLWLRLGEQSAIVGRHAEAFAALDRARAGEGIGRGPIDPTTAMTFVAALAGERGWLQQAYARYSPESQDGPNRVFADGLAAVWAFCAGAWDDPALGTSREWIDTLPAAQVLALWLDLRRGRSADEVAARAERLATNPEIRELAMLLRAAALVRLGNTETATELAGRALAGLERQGRVSVEAHVWTALAHRVAGDAALAAGDGIAAERHFRAAAGIAPACWFGRRR
ncbi:MAG: protein kinase [Acidobacteria bacterium]|nr:protein kinase [Acidobacteriota bacterium]